MNNKLGKISSYIAAAIYLVIFGMGLLIPLVNMLRLKELSGMTFPIINILEPLFQLLLIAVFCILITIKPKNIVHYIPIAITFLVLFIVFSIFWRYMTALQFRILPSLFNVNLVNLANSSVTVSGLTSPLYTIADTLFCFACGCAFMQGKAATFEDFSVAKNSVSKITAYIALGMIALHGCVLILISIIQSIRVHAATFPIATFVTIFMAFLVFVAYGILISTKAMSGNKTPVISITFLIVFIVISFLAILIRFMENRIFTSFNYYEYYQRTTLVNSTLNIIVYPLSVTYTALFSFSLGNSWTYGKLKAN